MAWNCQLTEMPNVSKMPFLSQLVFDVNQIKTVPSLALNPKLQVLKLSENLISKLPDISACKNNLKILKLNNNLLDSIPNFSLFSVLDTVTVQNNFLTFEDVIPLAQNNAISYKQYAPQLAFGSDQNFSLTEKQTFTIDFGIDKNVNGNQYKWFKNGVYVTTTTNSKLFFQQIKLADSGVYTCEVRNPLAPLLVLYSKSVTLKVNACLSLSQLKFATTDYSCNMGATISIDESSVIGGTKPFSYTLTSTEHGTLHYAYEAKFSNLFENSYQLEVKDKTGCKANYSLITLTGKKGTDCSSFVLASDPNASQNTILLEDSGLAKVYDKQGQLVTSFATPAEWDGKNKSGEFVPGFYVIELNGKVMQVTLIK